MAKNEVIEKEECKNADKNPECPYLVRIATLETDIKWLKKGYQLQMMLGTGTFLTVLSLALKLAGVI